MSPKPTLPCDVYLRVSRVGGRSGDSFISPEVQETSCRAIAQARGIEVGRVIKDLDQSGGKMDRPGLNEAITRIRAGVSGGIIVARVDRFARTLQGALDTLKEITDAGGVLVAADGDFDTTTAMGVFARDLMLGIAQLYRAQAKERWDETHVSMIERGIHSGQPPAGYKKGPDKRLVPNGNAEHIRKAFAMRGNRGDNWAEVARFLTEKGVPTKSGKTTWTAGGARMLLDNRAYLGEARFGDMVKVGAHEPLVSETIFRLANHKAARLSGERSDGRLLGGGLCRCGACGAGMTYGAVKQGARKYEFIRCGKGGGKGHAAIAVGRIEPYLTSVAEGVASAAPKGENVADAEMRLYSAEKMVAAVEAAQSAGELTPVAYGKALALALRERDAASAALDAALSVIGGAVPDWTDVRAGRAFLKQALGVVTVSPGRASVEERVTVEGTAT